MKKILFVFSLLIILLFGMSLSVFGYELSNDDEHIYVYHENELAYKADQCSDYVYTKVDTNLRNGPNIASEIVAVVPKDTKLYRVGRHYEFAVIQIDDVNYFMASNCLTLTEPENIIDWELNSKVEEIEVETINTTPTNYLGSFTLTAYCNCSQCCGQWAGGSTASGTTPTEGRTIACGSLPFGTRVYIEGLGEYVVEDRGVSGNWIDVYMSSHDACNQFGVQTRDVYLVS